MKQSLVFFLIAYSTLAFTQEISSIQKTKNRHELKLNALGLLTSEWLDLSYEGLINQESSFGMALQIGFDEESRVSNSFYRTFSLTPYYRRYFSSKFAKGFYVESFAMLHTNKDAYEDFLGTQFRSSVHTSFGLGFSIGGKFVSKDGFVADLYVGIGRNLGSNAHIEQDFVGRIGISLGYRF